MSIERWRPRQAHTRQEEALLRRLCRTKKLFGFLREHRHELFDDEFQSELEGMYRNTGAGKDPVPPALLAMAVLLQSYQGVSDAARAPYRRARYRGVRKNLFDVRRSAAVQNLETIQRRLEPTHEQRKAA